MFAEGDESFVNITNFDASKGSQDGFDKGDLIRGKGSHTQGFIRVLLSIDLVGLVGQ